MLSDIRHKRWEILVENLGISGATEFIIQYEKGYGDYGRCRKRFSKRGLDEILEEMKSMSGDKEKCAYRILAIPGVHTVRVIRIITDTFDFDSTQRNKGS